MRQIKKLALIAVCLAIVFSNINCLKQSVTSNAEITIWTDDTPKAYNPMIFGGFIEHFGNQIYGGFFDPKSPLSDDKGFRLDVIEAIKELKVPVIRWPGGCFVDSYHWEKGVGEHRQSYDDDRWGVKEPNSFGTLEFVELCNRIGAEPYICQNSFADVKEMADWVEFCNGTSGPYAELRKTNGNPEPFDIKFWSVGNERGGKEYIDRVRDASVAMKKVDSTILVTCSGAHGPNADIDPYLFETAGKHLDLLSIHQYWIHNFQEHQTPDYLSCMMLSEQPDKYIRAVVNSLEEANKRDQIKIAFDEWNLRSWHHPGFSGHVPRKVDYKDPLVVELIKARDKSLEPSLYTMADALFCASFFNACLRNPDDVAMANISCLVNQTGPLYVHPGGIIKRTHFHAMSMYANLLKPLIVKTQVNSDKLFHQTDSVSMVDAIATVDESGNDWAISLLNRHPTDKVLCNIMLGDKPLDGRYAATILTGDNADSFNDVEHPNRVVPNEVTFSFKRGKVTLPPHSLIIVQIKDEK